MKIVHVIVDRPLGYSDVKHDQYPLNYGYVPNVLGGDGEFQDVYIVSNEIKTAISEFDGKLIAIIKRADDVEDKWVVTMPHEQFTVRQIESQVNCMEQYFDSKIELL